MTEKMKKTQGVLHPFQRLQQELAELIAATPSGEKLPSEPFLARQLGVSRATLREAMRSFEGQGLIRRRQGVGTFVVGKSEIIEAGLEVLESIESMASHTQLEISMGNMDIIKLKADSTTAALFNCEPGCDMVEVKRVILAGIRPVAYLIDFLPAKSLTDEEIKNGFTGSVLDLLLTRGEDAPCQSDTAIKAVAAPVEIAKAMQIQRGDVLLYYDSKMYDKKDQLVVLSESYFLPGYFNFHIVRRVEGFIK